MTKKEAGRTGSSASLRDWLQLLHFGPSLFTVLLFAIYIFIAARGTPDPLRLLLLLLAQLATQFAISLFNDVWDLPLDSKTKPDKPLPSGAISLQTATLLGRVCVALALLLALPLGPWVVLYTVLGLGAGLLYNIQLKRTILSPLPFMVGFGVLPLWAWAGMDLPITEPVLWSVPLTAVLVLALHLADTLPDLRTDKAAGLNGLAHRLGLQRALLLCWGALGAGIVFAAVLAVRAGINSLLLWFVLGVALVLLACAWLIYWQRGEAGMRLMAGPIELGSMLVAIGWLAATL